MTVKNENRVIVLMGPTAVGKTGASILMARELGTEIISADSMQIYRHMDIGTEKPSPSELSAVPHHMIDIVEPTEDFSAGRFLMMARPVIEGLLSEGKVPLVVGGTGLYLRAMTRGLFEGPEADWELRRELLSQSNEELLKRLAGLDPEAAASVEPGNTRRLVRALEVCIKSGRPVSEMRIEGTSPLPYDFIKLALSRDRVELYGMIDGRVDLMLERGLVDEVRRVMETGPARTPMQAIGYKEVSAYLEGAYPLEEAVRLIKRNTRRYAKRQMTWFRKEPDLGWVDVTGIKEPEGVYERLVMELEEFSLP
jgi:tRNA dimethylallyltransferase